MDYLSTSLADELSVYNEGDPFRTLTFVLITRPTYVSRLFDAKSILVTICIIFVPNRKILAGLSYLEIASDPIIIIIFCCC